MWIWKRCPDVVGHRVVELREHFSSAVGADGADGDAELGETTQDGPVTRSGCAADVLNAVQLDYVLITQPVIIETVRAGAAGMDLDAEILGPLDHDALWQAEILGQLPQGPPAFLVLPVQELGCKERIGAFPQAPSALVSQPHAQLYRPRRFRPAHRTPKPRRPARQLDHRRTLPACPGRTH
ncbi:hypothetical protein ACFVYR_22185 [Streptomyces sp. NPDC058284]|uniref:hypothetical protein n=1 Tax=unclassified Streptomyces TaxID=2593676 RepID=UPI00364681A8